MELLASYEPDLIIHLRRVSTIRMEQLLELPGLTLNFYAQSGGQAI